MKLFAFFSSHITAARNCSANAVKYALDRNENARFVEASQLHIDMVEKAASVYLPSGLGFDSGTQIDIDASSDKKLVFRTAFHHMNEVGYYDGWTSHTVIVRPAFEGVSMSIGGRNRNDIKDYIHEIFTSNASIDLDWQGEPIKA